MVSARFTTKTSGLPAETNKNTAYIMSFPQFQEEFITNPLIKARKSLPSASKIKVAAEEILNKKNFEKATNANVIDKNYHIKQFDFTLNFRIQEIELSQETVIFCLMKFSRNPWLTLRSTTLETTNCLLTIKTWIRISNYL